MKYLVSESSCTEFIFLKKVIVLVIVLLETTVKL